MDLYIKNNDKYHLVEENFHKYLFMEPRTVNIMNAIKRVVDKLLYDEQQETVIIEERVEALVEMAPNHHEAAIVMHKFGLAENHEIAMNMIEEIVMSKENGEGKKAKINRINRINRMPRIKQICNKYDKDIAIKELCKYNLATSKAEARRLYQQVKGVWT